MERINDEQDPSVLRGLFQYRLPVKDHSMAMVVRSGLRRKELEGRSSFVVCSYLKGMGKTR